MMNSASTSKKILVIVDDPDIVPDAHLDSCERISHFVPVLSVRPYAQSSGYVAHLDEVRERFPFVLWCECMDDVLSRGVSYAAENIPSFTDGLKCMETLTSGDTSVDVYFDWELGRFVFAVDGRVGARLPFRAIRDEEGRAEVFADCAAHAIIAIHWADQEWQSRKPHPSDA